MRDEYLDGTDQSGGLPDVDAEPWYVGEERCRPGKANSINKRANTDSGDMLTLSLALDVQMPSLSPSRINSDHPPNLSKNTDTGSDISTGKVTHDDSYAMLLINLKSYLCYNTASVSPATRAKG